jgi:hypothetical protein
MARRTVRTIVLGFLAGAVGVLVFHQGFILILHLLGVLPNMPYSLQPTAPLGVPQVLSLAFWGGLWGIVLVWFMTRFSGDRLWVAILFGGILPPLVGVLVVTPLKGGDIAAWFVAPMMARAFVINAVWGLGTALSYRAGRRIA